MYWIVFEEAWKQFGIINHFSTLTHWGRVTHICVSKLTITCSDNGLSPRRHQAIYWTSARTLLIGPLGTNFSEILIGILIFSFKKMNLKISSAKWRPFCLGLKVLRWLRLFKSFFMEDKDLPSILLKGFTRYGLVMPYGDIDPQAITWINRFITNEVLCHSPETTFTWSVQGINLYNSFGHTLHMSSMS